MRGIQTLPVLHRSDGAKWLQNPKPNWKISKAGWWPAHRCILARIGVFLGVKRR